MSGQTYSIFKRKGSKGWHVFDGHMDTVAQARMYGQLRYTLGSEPTKITLSTAIADFDDDERTVFDTTTMPRSSTGQELLVANSGAFVTSFAIIQGPNTRIEANKRVKGMGWKFTDASGTKYKWAVDMRTLKWELQNSRGTVATFSAGFFDTQGVGHLSVEPGVGREMIEVVLITWGLVARSVMYREVMEKLKNSTFDGDIPGVNAPTCYSG